MITTEYFTNEYNKLIFSKDFIFNNFITFAIKKLSLFSDNNDEFNENKREFNNFLLNMSIDLNENERIYLNNFRKIETKDVDVVLWKLKHDLFKDIKNKNENEIETYAKEIVQWQKVLEEPNVKG